ncbi:MAG: hypothetical protein ACXWLM_10280, partial [Myxococcales bacterium]
IAPGGPYDIQVVDPQSGVGTFAGAFTVVANPPPVVTGLSPTQITTGGGTLVVSGNNFDAGSTVLLGSPVTGGVEFCAVPVSSRVAGAITVSVPATLIPAGCYVESPSGSQTPATAGFSLDIAQYLVRVQHSTDVSSGDFAALVVTGSSFNPRDAGVASSRLNVKRGQAGAVIAHDDLGNPFLYVAGGSSNGVDALGSIEVAPVGLFGDLGGACAGAACKFHQLDRTPLPSARAGVQLVARSVAGTAGTSYLYAIGGRTATPTYLNEIWRAQVLRNKDAPSMRRITVANGAGPGAGVWYYRVAALFPIADALNGNGAESLPSDEESVSLTGAQRPTVNWACTPGASKYRVYRTPAGEAVSGAEIALLDLTAACSGTAPGTMSFTDDGSATPDPATAPLPPGALGAWVNTGATLTTARYDFQARTVPDAAFDILVMGGCTSAGTAGDCGASTGSLEKILFSSAADLDGAVSSAGTGLTARARFGAAIATAGTANVAAGNSFMLVFGGENGATGNEVGGGAEVQVADISDLTAAIAFSNAAGAPNNVGVGGWAEITANQGFDLQTRLTNHSLDTLSGTLGNGPFSTAGNFHLSFNNTGGVTYTDGGTRFLCGEQLLRAFIYVVGGFASDATFTPTDTVERFVY